ncbi:MAG: universal stress protein [Gammaproteobacteria bacterium]
MQVVGGEPAQVILEQAEHINADLIVMGTHGGRSTSQTPIGSVASKVMQLSRIPIYLVPTVPVQLSLFPHLIPVFITQLHKSVDESGFIF